MPKSIREEATEGASAPTGADPTVEHDPAPVPDGGAAMPQAEVVARSADADQRDAVEAAASPWSGLNVAVIDDALHPPRLDRLSDEERKAVADLLANHPDVLQELGGLAVSMSSTPDEKLLALTRSSVRGESYPVLSNASPDVIRMIDEHRAFNGLMAMLRAEVAAVEAYDPYQPIPDVKGHDLILLDYYLDGSSGTGDRAIDIAKTIHARSDRPANQQIVLMSSIERVRMFRTSFRERSEVSGSSFAFVAKADLNEAWKVKAHLGMLGRARPHASALLNYRDTLGTSLEKAKSELLALVDDLDIGDYAFLQREALMKEGHPLGDYVFWLLSSELMTLAFERDEMREQQHALDRLDFVGESFSAAEPSTIVARLFHSALVSRNVGPLAPHPRADANEVAGKYPLVQLGDVFLDKAGTKAIVVLSADCDLAFSPHADRKPDGETPIILVPGSPARLREGASKPGPKTEGILKQEEVYRIDWSFSKYRSVSLRDLEHWLTAQGIETVSRDRLRPLFALKLQQEFGAHLMRIGVPLLPPMTTKAKGTLYGCLSNKAAYETIDSDEIIISRFKGRSLLRITTSLAGKLKRACEQLRADAEAELQALPHAKRADFQKKIDSLSKQIESDDVWMKLLNGVELAGNGSIKQLGQIGFVLGAAWTPDGKPRVVLEIDESPTLAPPAPGEISPGEERSAAA